MDTVYIKTEFSDSDSDDTCSIQMQLDNNWETTEENETNTIKSLSEKSKKQYDSIYKTFMDWKSNQDDSICEETILKYFENLQEKCRAATFYPMYSMLRSTLIEKHNINIGKYKGLHAFLKRHAQGYVAKKSESFSLDQINTFLNEAPDNEYLATKAVLIIGSVGACRANQLYSLKNNQVQDIGNGLLIALPLRDHEKIVRKFTIIGQYYEICKKYMELRPPDCPCDAFFLMYTDGKCFPKNLGINKLGNMGKQIATYLGLDNPEKYTGHCFKKSSRTLLVDAEGDLITMKRHHRWKSVSVVEATNQILQTEAAPRRKNPKNKNSLQGDNRNEGQIMRIVNSSNITINFFINQSDKTT